MNYRYATLLSETSITADKTQIIDLDVHDIMSRLDIFYRYSGSQHAMDSYGYADIEKIEIVDGSDVLFSLTGGECQALNINNRKCPTMTHGQHRHGDSEMQVFGIDFGRTLWDRELAFDPTKYTNPQLKITVDFGTSDTGISTSYLTVKAHMFDERKVTPTGFLMAKEHYSYTIGDDGSYEYVELPQDYLIRKMLVKGYLAAYEPWHQIEDIRLDINNEAKIPFDVNVEEYYRTRKGVDQLVESALLVQVDTTGNCVYYVEPTDYWVAPVLTPIGESTISMGNPRGGKLTLTASTTASCAGIVRGYLPNHCIHFPFGIENDPTDWFDPTGVDKARLRLESGSDDGGVGAIVLEQLRPY